MKWYFKNVIIKWRINIEWTVTSKCVSMCSTTKKRDKKKSSESDLRHFRIRVLVGDHPNLIRLVRGFFNVPQKYQHSRNCETGPPAYRPYPRRLESLTICRWNYKGSTFLLSYLSVGLVEVSNSQPPASQPGAQPSEPPVRVSTYFEKSHFSGAMF